MDLFLAGGGFGDEFEEPTPLFWSWAIWATLIVTAIMEEADRVLNLALKLHEPLAEMVSMQDITRYIKDPDTKDLIIHHLNDGLEKNAIYGRDTWQNC